MFIVLSRDKSNSAPREFKSFLRVTNPDAVREGAAPVLERRFYLEYEVNKTGRSWSGSELVKALCGTHSPLRSDSYDVRFVAVPNTEVTKAEMQLTSDEQDPSDCSLLRKTMMNVPMPMAGELKRRKSKRVEWRGDMALFLLMNLPD